MNYRPFFILQSNDVQSFCSTPSRVFGEVLIGHVESWKAQSVESGTRELGSLAFCFSSRLTFHGHALVKNKGATRHSSESLTAEASQRPAPRLLNSEKDWAMQPGALRLRKFRLIEPRANLQTRQTLAA